MRPFSPALFILMLFTASVFSQQPRHPISPGDSYRLQSISDLQVSPEGSWIAYVLSSIDSLKDKRNSDLWMVSVDGKESVQLTNSPEGEGHPRFSPDGKYLSFLAKRGEDKQSQVYLLDRRGGEAIRLTSVKGDIEDFVWSPDGSRLVLALKDPDLSDTASTKIRTPYVMDRYHFKQDNEGYLDRRATHLYLFTVASKSLDTLTRGRFDETEPAFSPDGSLIAFVSNRTDDPDRNENSDLYIIGAKPGSPVRQVTTWPGTDSHPVWSPDGSTIAYLQSSSDENFTSYGENYLAVISKDGGTPKILSKSVDRPVSNPRWSSDGRSLLAIVEDDREQLVASFDVTSGAMTRIADGERSIGNLVCNTSGSVWACLVTTPQCPSEIYALESGKLRKLTSIQDAFLAPLQLASVEGFRSKSKDGTIVSGLLYLPPGYQAGKTLPLILYIHGGPMGQDEYGFDLTRQIYACAGYAVAAVNYRGSSGRGVAFTRSIYGDWGDKEIVDIVGAAEYLVQRGIADEHRMGIGGWSYGGISTNYAIASDNRFKAAVSGAGSSLQLSMYGVDQYIAQYDNEVGPPWKNSKKWIELSYPFFHADKIKTPTLFMASQNDFNVPAVGAEQMYQALRSLGVPTELVIYPNQHHGLSVPSYVKDRFERHIRWFDRYLKPQ